MVSEGTSTVRLRSIYVSPPGESLFPLDAEAQGGVCGGRDVAQAPANSVVDQFIDDAADEKVAANTLTLPESTHSLLFLECVCSLPFWFAISIVLISFGCLWLAFLNNIQGGTKDNPFSIPVNVPTEVRIAQYLSILIALLMEEGE